MKTLPTTVITPAMLAFLPQAVRLGDGLKLLLRQVTLFDLAWVLLLTLGLEDQDSVPGLDAGAAVLAVWILSTMTQVGPLSGSTSSD